MRLLSVTFAIFLLAAAPAGACNVPVFRYALEHWAAGAYRVTLYHHGPLAAADLARIADLERAPTNAVKFHSIDVALQPTEEAPARLPWLMVRYPVSSHEEGVVWQGPLEEDVAAALLDSPSRRELARRLLAGDTVVWVVLESGRPEEDEAVAQKLAAHSRRLEATLKLPVLSSDLEDRLHAETVPLRLAFSVLRVTRTDPAERLFVRMLLGTEADLEGQSGPLVFPVFGRGRALNALVGAGISEANLTKTAEFLTAACSCRVKEANPGVDLLLSADWPAAPSADPVPDAEDGAAPVPLPPGKPKEKTPAAMPEAEPSSGRGEWLFASLFVAALVVAASFGRQRRRR